MLTPSGSTWMASTRAPVAARIVAPAALPEPFAPSSTMCRPLGIDRAGQPAPVVEVALDGVGRVDPATELGVADPAELGLAPDEVLELVLDGVVELEAVGVEHLEPVVVGRVVRGRHHDPGAIVARTASGRPAPASGTTPTTWTSTPRLVAPATMAATNMSPDRRVSWPTTMADPGSASRLAVARPSA